MGFDQLAMLRDGLVSAGAGGQYAEKAGCFATAIVEHPGPGGVVDREAPEAAFPGLPAKSGVQDSPQGRHSRGLDPSGPRTPLERDRAEGKTWCRGHRYWTRLAAGAKRVDLTGSEAGRVSAGRCRVCNDAEGMSSCPGTITIVTVEQTAI